MLKTICDPSSTKSNIQDFLSDHSVSVPQSHLSNSVQWVCFMLHGLGALSSQSCSATFLQTFLTWLQQYIYSVLSFILRNRPYLSENRGSRPITRTQADEGQISSWVGDDQRIPAVDCFAYLFLGVSVLRQWRAFLDAIVDVDFCTDKLEVDFVEPLCISGTFEGISRNVHAWYVLDGTEFADVGSGRH